MALLRQLTTAGFRPISKYEYICACHIFVFEKWDASEQGALSDKCGSYLTWSM